MFPLTIAYPNENMICVAHQLFHFANPIIPANLVRYFPNKFKRFLITVELNSVQIIGTQTNMIVDMLTVCMSTNNRLKIFSENRLYPFQTNFMSRFRSTFSCLKWLNDMKCLYGRFAVFVWFGIKILMRIMLIKYLSKNFKNPEDILYKCKIVIFFCKISETFDKTVKASVWLFSGTEK